MNDRNGKKKVQEHLDFQTMNFPVKIKMSSHQK